MQRKNTTIIVDKRWTLFLDRDKVINDRLDHANYYVTKWDEFVFIDGALSALCKLAKIFPRILVVTNQRGVHLNIMSEQALELIHTNMTKVIQEQGGRIDKIYACTQGLDGSLRKPKEGMGLLAKKDFPEIDFKKSIMVGDALTDIQFGKNLGMKTVLISSWPNDNLVARADFVVPALSVLPSMLSFTEE